MTGLFPKKNRKTTIFEITEGIPKKKRKSTIFEITEESTRKVDYF